MSVNTQNTFTDEAIRDTSSHNGTTVFNGDFQIKTLIIENGLNQQVTIQCEGSAHADFSIKFNIGSSFNVSATTNTYQTCDSYFPYWRAVAQCSTAPTTGDLNIVIYGVE